MMCVSLHATINISKSLSNLSISFFKSFSGINAIAMLALTLLLIKVCIVFGTIHFKEYEIRNLKLRLCNISKMTNIKICKHVLLGNLTEEEVLKAFNMSIEGQSDALDEETGDEIDHF